MAYELETPGDPEALAPERLLEGYARGAFPMADPASGALVWHSPDPRAVLPLDRLRVSRSLAGVVSAGTFEVRTDTAFESVVRACAEPAPGRQEVWLDERLVRAHTELHRLGRAHSVEAWRGGGLVGGLYGVTIGGAFFGESMFHRPELDGTDASKVCLVRLVGCLRAGGFELLDVQYLTPHLERLGCVEIPRTEYLERLRRAMHRPGRWPSL